MSGPAKHFTCDTCGQPAYGRRCQPCRRKLMPYRPQKALELLTPEQRKLPPRPRSGGRKLPHKQQGNGFLFPKVKVFVPAADRGSWWTTATREGFTAVALRSITADTTHYTPRHDVDGGPLNEQRTVEPSAI